MASNPKRQAKTSQEVALGIRQEAELSTEVAKGEKRFKALTRNRLGAKSLLAGAPGASSKTAEPTTQWSNVDAPKKRTEIKGPRV